MPPRHINEIALGKRCIDADIACGWGGHSTRAMPDAKRLKDLESENARLKKLLAEQIFENDVIKDVLRKRT